MLHIYIYIYMFFFSFFFGGGLFAFQEFLQGVGGVELLAFQRKLSKGFDLWSAVRRRNVPERKWRPSSPRAFK